MRRFAGVLLVDHRGWLLLQERDEHPVIDPERWGLPGGHLDDGEEPRAGAVRELAEETGLVVTPGDLELWRVVEVWHAAYSSLDEMSVFAGATVAADDDVVLGEGRRIVFVDPDEVPSLDLTASAAGFLPDFLGSPVHARLREQAGRLRREQDAG